MKKIMKLVSLIGFPLVATLGSPSAQGADAGALDPAVRAINALGLELLAKGSKPDANALLSPYSIQSALAMTWAGAAGDTQAEMARVLHYPADEAKLHDALKALRGALEVVAADTAKRAEASKENGGPSEPIILTMANRLFGQQGYEFRPPFLKFVEDQYLAPLQLMDFIRDAQAARGEINGWVAGQTRQRIRDLIPTDGLDAETRLVLVNAIYLKAPWQHEFVAAATRPRPFHVNGDTARDVPMMVQKERFGYAAREGFKVITLPYTGGDVQFLILLPDEVDGLAALEAKVTPELLVTEARPKQEEVILQLPKFKLEPPMFRLGQTLRSMGMKSAFDVPPGSANFDRMAPRKPDDYLFISEVFHRTFLELDEKGTEAAAATAVVMARATAMIEKAKPIEVRVDRPFLFAIQHRPSGACLFLGRVTDPR
jgi:serpin B